MLIEVVGAVQGLIIGLSHRTARCVYQRRIDLQVKLHGYQVELEDIERNLLRLPQISRAAVLPKVRNHKVSNLYAWVVCPDKHISDKTYTSRLKEDLLSFLPEHLIPKKFIFVKQLPVNGSGRLDRQALEHMVS